MNSKLIAAAVLVTGVLGSAAVSADPGRGTVHFTGSVEDTPCQVTVNNGADVDFGQIALAPINGKKGTEGPRKNFSIKLAGCTFTDETTAAFTFTGTTVADDNTTLDNPAGSASGVGVQIKDPAKNLVVLDNTTAVTVPVVTGDNDINFSATVVSTDDAVTAGSLDATATFSVAYQ